MKKSSEMRYEMISMPHYGEEVCGVQAVPGVMREGLDGIGGMDVWNGMEWNDR